MYFKDKRQYFAGYELDSRVFVGDEAWISIFEIETYSFENIFTDLVLWVKKIHEAAQIPKHIGASFHFKKCNGFLVNQTFRERYLRVIENCKIPFQSLCHIPYRKDQLPPNSGFIPTLLKQMELCSLSKSKGIILHPPSNIEDTTEQFISQLTDQKVLKVLEDAPLYLCIENAQESGAYFQSLSNLIILRESLEIELKQIGKGHLISFFKFCFDTGHYLLYQQRDGNGEEEWMNHSEKFLPHVLVFHIHSNDGSSDQHLLPYTKADPPLKRLPFLYKAFFENCHRIMNWLEESEAEWKTEERFFVLEVNPSFTKKELISFWHRLGRRLKLISK
ncbi:hypothetical protein NEF87_004815 [Candidatus Lokiarchaeum ossiferum]|uniref:Xylose isomerase-like TIM barrel domain-containing protein n=1 Tax=Candidatus Lokiarchaeum ossiferum TaxID=2951803 RepID=A0ABY6HYP1_9ARCH|nr:hypothetical protein NEF87_004815 [Candidatus Lokiarchaeum sp. B-35]